MTSTQLVAVTDSPSNTQELINLAVQAVAHHGHAVQAIRDSDGHAFTAGLFLQKAKGLVRNTPGLTWQGYIESYCAGISRRRADELISVVEKKTTFEELRASKAASVAKARNLTKNILKPVDAYTPEYISTVRIEAASESLRSLSTAELDSVLIQLDVIPWRAVTASAMQQLPRFSALIAQNSAAAIPALQ